MRRQRFSGSAAAAVLATAVLAAAALPGHRPGLAAAVVAWGCVLAAVFDRAPRRRPPLFAAAALVLSLAPLDRDATWVVVPDLCGAFVAAGLWAAPAQTWRGIAAALARALRLRPPVPALVRSTFGALDRTRVAGALPVVRGVALGGILIVVFGTLFVSADAAFAEVVNRALVPDWTVDLLPARVVLFLLVASLGGALALSAATPAPVLAAREPGRLFPRAEWLPALALLDLLFAAFVAVQIAVLFGGHDHVLHTTGLTYAEYARQGFVQLIAVAALTLAVATAAHRRAAGDRGVLNVLLGVLFALTFVVLASALRRLGLYEDAFGFTRTRLFAHWVILLLGALFVLVAALAALHETARIPQAVVLTTLTALALGTAANPDALIARRNIERDARTHQIDIGYLSGLSADATPALAAAHICNALRARDLDPSLAAFNLARRRAEKAQRTCTR